MALVIWEMRWQKSTRTVTRFHTVDELNFADKWLLYPVLLGSQAGGRTREANRTADWGWELQPVGKTWCLERKSLQARSNKDKVVEKCVLIHTLASLFQFSIYFIFNIFFRYLLEIGYNSSTQNEFCCLVWKRGRVLAIETGEQERSQRVSKCFVKIERDDVCGGGSQHTGSIYVLPEKKRERVNVIDELGAIDRCFAWYCTHASNFLFHIFYGFAFILFDSDAVQLLFQLLKAAMLLLVFFGWHFFFNTYRCCHVMILKLENDTAINALRWQMLTIWFKPNAERKKR